MNVAEKFYDLAKPDHKYTLGELLAEIKGVYEAHVESQATLFHCDPEKLSEALGGYVPDMANEAYSYVIEGKLDVKQPNYNSDGWLDYAALIAQSQLNYEFYSEGLPATANMNFFIMSFVRFKLDQDTYPGWERDWSPVIFQDSGIGFLTLKEVAFLAQMTEKAVRNATQPTAVDRLQTMKNGVRTVVDSLEALRWLKGRRSFKPTSIVK